MNCFKSCCERFDCFNLFGARRDAQLNRSSNSPNVSIGRYQSVPTNESVKYSAFPLNKLTGGSSFQGEIPKLDKNYNYKNDPHLNKIFNHESSKTVLAKGFGGSFGLSKNIGIPLLSLFHVMIGETKVDSSSFLCPLTMGTREDSAGPHGPFYAVLFSKDLSHAAYLVPNSDIKNLQHPETIISKIVTYEEYYQNISGEGCNIT